MEEKLAPHMLNPVCKTLPFVETCYSLAWRVGSELHIPALFMFVVL